MLNTVAPQLTVMGRKAQESRVFPQDTAMGVGVGRTHLGAQLVYLTLGEPKVLDVTQLVMGHRQK
jgi:hypothetical protein